jgi:hypothetical protein
LAVGDAITATGTQTLAETWNGAAWAAMKTVAIPTGISSVLSGVSCTAPTACTAVGSTANNVIAGVGLVERWNGKKWTEQSTGPSVPGAVQTALGAVSCTSPTACIAVGESIPSSGSKTLSYLWNGKSWAPLATPSISGTASSVLNGISCTSPNACTAVGDELKGGTATPLAERYG